MNVKERTEDGTDIERIESRADLAGKIDLFSAARCGPPQSTQQRESSRGGADAGILPRHCRPEAAYGLVSICCIFPYTYSLKHCSPDD
jgi:hypothetical protein